MPCRCFPDLSRTVLLQPTEPNRTAGPGLPVSTAAGVHSCRMHSLPCSLPCFPAVWGGGWGESPYNRCIDQAAQAEMEKARSKAGSPGLDDGIRPSRVDPGAPPGLLVRPCGPMPALCHLPRSKQPRTHRCMVLLSRRPRAGSTRVCAEEGGGAIDRTQPTNQPTKTTPTKTCVPPASALLRLAGGPADGDGMPCGSEMTNRTARSPTEPPGCLDRHHRLARWPDPRTSAFCWPAGCATDAGHADRLPDPGVPPQAKRRTRCRADPEHHGWGAASPTRSPGASPTHKQPACR